MGTVLGHSASFIFARDLTRPPEIRLWYEGPYEFGHLGIPQERINIVGNVASSAGIFRLRYRLNGGAPIPLHVGPDRRRLQDPGDFNIAIPQADLRPGQNHVIITATDWLGRRSEKSLSITYHPGKRWPLPYQTRWAEAAAIAGQAQVVDGLWEIRGGRLRTVQTGYDRVVAIGDMHAWAEYEVTVPVIIHRFTGPEENPGGVGIIARWKGHAGGGILPSRWTRLGAYAYYSHRLHALALRWNDEDPITAEKTLELGRAYFFKLRAEDAGSAGRYSFKVWPVNEPEPACWDLIYTDPSRYDLKTGSVLLVANYAEVSFGDVLITPLDGGANPRQHPPARLVVTPI